MKILLVDDDNSVLFALSLLLKAFGHTVTPCPGGEQALQTLSENPDFEVILCDLRMDGLNGFDVLAKTRGIIGAPPFLLMSGHATEDEVFKAYTLGACGFLGKPFRPEEIKEALRKIDGGKDSASRRLLGTLGLEQRPARRAGPT